MKSKIKLSTAIQQLLRCAICKAELELVGEQFRCTNPDCSNFFPIINGIPILINEDSSIFSVDDFIHQRNTFLKLSPESKIRKTLKRLMPDIGKNVKGKKNYDKFAKLLLAQSNTPKVLVLGGGILGQGLEAILSYPAIEVVESDISLGPRTILIGDAHDIPFENNSFDGVIAQAVLEHVVDPWRCVEEIYRVLKKDGLVYAETPFMQQVHGGRYDFTRFTHLGQRRLFRKFKEIDSGAVVGPATALAWSYKYFLLSFTKLKQFRSFINIFASITSFYFKYFDYYLIDRPGTFDAASGYYFIGQKSNQILSDQELIKLYRGCL